MEEPFQPYYNNDQVCMGNKVLIQYCSKYYIWHRYYKKGCNIGLFRINSGRMIKRINNYYTE